MSAAGAAERQAGVGQWLGELVGDRSLSPKHRQLRSFLEADPRAAAFQTASELGKANGATAATVVRFAQVLGFKGWPDFQLQLRHHLLGGLLPTDVARQQGISDAATPLEASISRDLQNLHTALDTIDPRQVEEVARLIGGSRKTVIVAEGSWAAVGVVLAHLGGFMGLPIQLETRGGPNLMAALGSLDEDCCVIGVSFWRLTKSAVLGLKSAHARGVPTVAITDARSTPIADYSDHMLVVPTGSVSFFQSVAAGISLAYGLLATLHLQGGDEVDRQIRATQELYSELDVLYT